MKVLLIKDVYKLGHAGDVKKVADGYGRNFLIPQGLAVLATPGSLKQAEHIRKKATATRELMNTELQSVAEQIQGKLLTFTCKAGETGKLYGSITTQQIADEITKLIGHTVDRRQIESQPIRMVGEFKARIRLTIDLVPEIKINVLKEGEELETEKPARSRTPRPRKGAKAADEPQKETKEETAESKPEEPAAEKTK